MSASVGANSAPKSSRPKQAVDPRAVDIKTHRPPISYDVIPEELLVGLPSTVSSRSTPGHTAHHRPAKVCGFRRPDAVWHHQMGREKYKFFLEQPTSLTGAGRDISFLCDATVTKRTTTPLPPLTDRSGIGHTQNLSVSESLIPEEYHIVNNKGLQNLEFYEDAFTVQLRDDEQKLRAFPSLRPSGRLEVIQLMRIMDDMLEKAGVDQQFEELTEISQMEALLELVQVEQNIYNVVFHEVIRQVSVGCAERGQLLAKLRQRYQSLLERIPCRLKALHTEAVAQRAVDRRLTEEIHRIKTSIQKLNMELSRIRDHDASVSQEAERAHRQLAGALEQCQTNSDVVQGYQEFYELHRGRYEAQLLQMTEERDSLRQFVLDLALKVIRAKRLTLISQIHIVAQSWFNTAVHCRLFLSSKDTEDLTILMVLTTKWKEQLTAFMANFENIEHAQCEQISAIQQGISKWLALCSTQNDCFQYGNASLDKCHADLKDWSNTLALQCDSCQGEKLLLCHPTLSEIDSVQESCLDRSLELFRRHASPDGATHRGQQDLRELDEVLSELLKQLETQVTRYTGIHGQIMSLLGLIESEVTRLGEEIAQAGMMTVSDWLKLEKALQNWKSLAEKVFENVCSKQSEEKMDTNKPEIFSEAEKASEKMQAFITSLSPFTDGENHRLSDEVSFIHMAQTRWMLDLLFLTVPEYSEEQEQEHRYVTNISLQTLDEDAQKLTEKLNLISMYISSSCLRILEEQRPNPYEVESEDEMNECRKLQECTDWGETTKILLRRATGGAVELPVPQADLASRFDVAVCPADSMEHLVNQEVPGELKAVVKDETAEEPSELLLSEAPVLKLIGYDGNITERKLGESRVQLKGTEQLVVSPATDEAREAFSNLTTVLFLQQELHDAELRVQSTEQRAFKAEEALQAALEKILDLERQLQGRPSLEPESNEESRTTQPLSPLPVSTAAPPKKTAAEGRPRSIPKKTKKQ
ncbi:axonemal dynein light chain domain-containing protein 1 isoform 3-T3 [Spinachia spinachia]